MYTVTITSQGQISIPARLRRELGLDKNKKALVSREGKKIIVEPVQDLLAMRGSLKTNKKPLSNKKLHDFFAKSVAGEYATKIKTSQ